MSTTELFKRAVDLALELDKVYDAGPPSVSGPDAISAIICDTAGGWPGGGSGEPVSGGGLSDPTQSAAIRNLTSTRRDDTADLVSLDRNVDKFVASIASISAKCKADEPPTDWDEAVKDCHILTEAKMVQAALDVGVELFHDVVRAHDAITTIKRIHDGHCAHAPDLFYRTLQDQSGCRSCARVELESKRATRLLCQWCYRRVHDLEDLGAPVELQTDPNCWPSEEMIKAREDGRTVLYRQEHAAWLRSHGLDPNTVHQQRQERRGA